MKRYVQTQIRRPGSEMVAKYEQLDVSTIYEAQGRIGLVSSEIRPLFPDTLIAGPAVTVACYAEDNLMIHAAIEQIQPGDVLVITTIGESTSGMIGELIVTALKKRGVKGIIIDAGIRDIAALRKIGVPIWSKAISSQGARKVRGGWVNAPVVCGGAAVHPGDMIIADDDGVVVVRYEDLEDTLKASLQRIENEEHTKARIERGELSIDFYNLREVLQKENVAYVESADELAKEASS